MFQTMLQAIAFAVALVGTASGAPNHLKTVSVDKQALEADLMEDRRSPAPSPPGVNAGAGYGGGASASSSASASASADGGSNFGVAPATGSGGTLFDQIFNIPISILKSVNQYANNKDPDRSADLGQPASQ
ncbi:unnamed protein product, partial [Nesidiocoris tenuis]